jgi:hypothetical protein
MLFRKSIEPRCSYCQRANPIENEEVICVKKGIVDESFSCRHFVYDPLKRIPPTPAVLDLSTLDDADFEL